MKTNFNHITKVKNKISTMLNISELEKLYKTTIERAYNFSQTDFGLSDALYYEASIMNKRLISLKIGASHNYKAA